MGGPEGSGISSNSSAMEVVRGSPASAAGGGPAGGSATSFSMAPYRASIARARAKMGFITSGVIVSFTSTLVIIDRRPTALNVLVLRKVSAHAGRRVHRSRKRSMAPSPSVSRESSPHTCPTSMNPVSTMAFVKAKMGPTEMSA